MDGVLRRGFGLVFEASSTYISEVTQGGDFEELKNV